MRAVHEVRTLLQRHRPERSCDGYPAEARAAAVSLARALLREGHSRTGVALELGLAPATLGRWLEDEAGEDTAEGEGFVPVILSASCRSAGPASSLTLVSPGGYRVEGLDIAGVVDLLNRLP